MSNAFEPTLKRVEDFNEAEKVFGTMVQALGHTIYEKTTNDAITLAAVLMSAPKTDEEKLSARHFIANASINIAQEAVVMVLGAIVVNIGLDDDDANKLLATFAKGVEGNFAPRVKLLRAEREKKEAEAALLAKPVGRA